MTSYVAPQLLLDGGPQRFTRQVERLLGQLGFKDVVNIDGPGDNGGDLLGTRAGRLWVFQAKWKSRGPVPAGAVDELSRAWDHYGAERGAVITNTKPSADALQRVQELTRINRDIDFWTGTDLQQLYAVAQDHPALRLRDYQDQAVSALWADLNRRRRALLILATGLGKTVIGGEVIGQYLRGSESSDVLVVAHTKDLVNQLERALWRHLPKETRRRCSPETTSPGTCAASPSPPSRARSTPYSAAGHQVS